jgi:chromosome segregation ATPase
MLGAVQIDLTDLVRQIEAIRRAVVDEIAEVKSDLTALTDDVSGLEEQADATIAALQRVEAVLTTLVAKGEAVSVELDALTAEVERNTTVDESAITLMEQLAQMLRDHADDPAAIRSLADKLETSSSRLATAVTANTPAAPTPTP